jgi:signal transduction histidine kinase
MGILNKKSLFTFLAASICLQSAFSDSRPAVRLALAEYPGYVYKDENGINRGIDVDFACKIAQYAGRTISIVQIADDSDQALHMLDSGSIDILGDTVKTPERTEKYLFSELAQGYSYNSIYVRADDDRFSYGNIQQLSVMKFGCAAHSESEEQFIQWCIQHGFTPDITVFQSNAAVKTAITDGKIDAGIIGAEFVENYRTIQKFSPLPYYFAFRKQDTALKNIIDSAMEKFFMEEPSYKEKLNRKYLTSQNVGIEVFTKEEKQFAAAHPVIKTATWKKHAPFSESINGKIKGIIPDYYAHLSKLTGIRFQFDEYETPQDAEEAVKNGKEDILAFYIEDVGEAAQKQMLLTRVYTTLNAAVISRTASEKITSAAVINVTEEKVKESIAQLHKNITVTGYKNAETCFDAMKHGKADAVVCALPVAVWLINRNSASQFHLTALPYITWNICGAVAPENDILCSMLNKAIQQSEPYMESILSAHTIPENSLRSFISRIPVIGITIFACIMFFMAVLLASVLILVHKRQKEKAVIEAVKAEKERKENELASLEKNTETRNIFFSNISHDMRTPLNAVIGFTSLAIKQTNDKVLRDYLSKIQSSGNLLLELINDTLTISKINSGKFKLNLAPVDSTDLISSLIIPVKEAADQKGIILTVDTSGLRKRCILADELNIQKIYLNLLTNAIKYTSPGGHIEFTVRNDVPGKFESEGIVKDTGIGISQDFLPHIFEPFLQEYRSGKEVSGTGLGLSIVKDLVDLMGGTIAVESKLNKGSVFTVRYHFEEVDPVCLSQPDTASASEQALLAGKNILLCEDNTLNREIALAMLEDRNMTVVPAQNGKEGCDIFAGSKEHDFDAILMDIRMPVMDGYEAARTIRSMRRSDSSSIPIIAMSADAFADDVQKCLTHGMNAHISKPVNQNRLYTVLCSLLCKQKSGK